MCVCVCVCVCVSVREYVCVARASVRACVPFLIFVFKDNIKMQLFKEMHMLT